MEYYLFLSMLFVTIIVIVWTFLSPSKFIYAIIGFAISVAVTYLYVLIVERNYPDNITDGLVGAWIVFFFVLIVVLAKKHNKPKNSWFVFVLYLISTGVVSYISREYYNNLVDSFKAKYNFNVDELCARTSKSNFVIGLPT